MVLWYSTVGPFFFVSWVLSMSNLQLRYSSDTLQVLYALAPFLPHTAAPAFRQHPALHIGGPLKLPAATGEAAVHVVAAAAPLRAEPEDDNR